LLTTRGFSNLQYKKVGELFPKKVAKLVEFTLPKKNKNKNKIQNCPQSFAEKTTIIFPNDFFFNKKTLYL
jgi:hypothetical protein